MTTTWKILSVKMANIERQIEVDIDTLKELQEKRTELESKIWQSNSDLKAQLSFKLSSINYDIRERTNWREREEKRLNLCRNILQSERVSSMRKQVDFFLNQDKVLIQQIESMTDKFVAQHITYLLQRDFLRQEFKTLEEFEDFICSKAKISIADVQAGVLDENIITGTFYEQVGFFHKILLDYFSEEEASWILCYQLILDSIVRQSAKGWLTKFPQFQKIASKDIAINAYNSLGYKEYSEDSFQFASWLFCAMDSQKDFFPFEQEIESGISKAGENSAYIQFRTQLLPEEKKVENNVSLTMEEVDQYSGIEFERFVGSLFEADGYSVGYTLASNDKGVDIIVRRDGVSIGIQCKCYNGAVGLSAVQEAFAGKDFYHLDKAMVVTNSKFTKAAKDLAQSTNVILWDRNILTAKISLL